MSKNELPSPNPTTMMDLHHTHTQYILNLNKAQSSKTLFCDVIYFYCKVALAAVENKDEVDISVRTYIL